MDIKDKVLQAVAEAKRILKTRKEIKEAEIQQNRYIIENNPTLVAKADKIIERLPYLIKDSLINNKYSWQGLKITDLNADEIYGECGVGHPIPGTFTEYLYNRLIQAGFKPDCWWDYNQFVPDFWPGKFKAWMSIDIHEYFKTEESK